MKRQGAAEHPLVLWSPDRRYFVTYRADRRAVKKLYAIESFGDSPQDIRPRLWEYPCPFAGDSDEELPHFALCVGDVKSRKMTMVQAPPYLDPVFTSEEKSFVRWLPDSSGFYFTWFSRGYGEGRLYLAEAATGAARQIVRETTDGVLAERTQRVRPPLPLPPGHRGMRGGPIRCRVPGNDRAETDKGGRGGRTHLFYGKQCAGLL